MTEPHGTQSESSQSRLAERYDTLYANETHDPETRAHGETLAPIAKREWPQDRREALVHLARPGGRLLEIGCGPGEVLATLAPNYDALVGVELSSIRAAGARRNLAHLPHCTVLAAGVEDLDDQGLDPFDCILWADVIEHVVDVIQAMHTLARLARPGAQLVTVTPNVAFLPQRLRILTGKAPNTALPWYPHEGFGHPPAETHMLDAGHLHYFTFRQLETLYRVAGFVPTQRLGVGSRIQPGGARLWGRLRNCWPTLLSGLVCVAGEYHKGASGAV